MTAPNDEVVSRILDSIISHEGGFVNNPNDKGGPTIWGISQNAHPEAWKNGPPTEAEAREIYLQRYVKNPGFDKIQAVYLRHQIIDFAVNSGVAVAIMKLQKVLGVLEDGILGPATLATLATRDPKTINNQLMCERLKMIGRIISKNKSQAVFASGWISRCVEFCL